MGGFSGAPLRIEGIAELEWDDWVGPIDIQQPGINLLGALQVARCLELSRTAR
jgi:hypothetical protein